MEIAKPPPQGDVNKGPTMLIATWVIVGVTVMVVACRVAVRKCITKSLWWDDWTILLALLGNVIGAGLDSVEVHYGFGRPDAYLTKWQLIEYRKYTYGEWIQTFATLMWTKVSICLFLMRIPATKALLRPLQAAVVFLALSNVILTVLWIVQCRPVDAAWDPDVKGNCFGRGQVERIVISQASTEVISAVSDFAFSGYPILILWKVQLRFRTKIALCCLMGTGVLVGVCCIVRTVLNFQALARDYTYGGIDNWFWRLFEVQGGIVAACTPTLLPGYKFLKDKTKSRFSSKGHTQLTDEIGLRDRSRAKIGYTANARSSASESPTNFQDVEYYGNTPVLPADKIQVKNAVDVISG